jgi:hypothetical protein
MDCANSRSVKLEDKKSQKPSCQNLFLFYLRRGFLLFCTIKYENTRIGAIELTKTLIKAPFKADHVGSFLRPERLKRARLQKTKRGNQRRTIASN